MHRFSRMKLIVIHLIYIQDLHPKKQYEYCIREPYYRLFSEATEAAHPSKSP